jgi:hypothetical protein
VVELIGDSANTPTTSNDLPTLLKPKRCSLCGHSNDDDEEVSDEVLVGGVGAQIETAVIARHEVCRRQKEFALSDSDLPFIGGSGGRPQRLCGGGAAHAARA